MLLPHGFLSFLLFSLDAGPLLPPDQTMTQHFLIRPGHQVIDRHGKLLGEEGDIIALETDSESPEERSAANGLLRRSGGANAVVLVSSPEKPKSKGKKKKKASYKTRDMNAEEPAAAPEEPEAEPEEPEAEAPEEDEAG